MFERAAAPDPEPAASSSPASALADRRTFVRLTTELAATCRPATRGHDVGWPGQIHDISCGGVGLILRHRFRPGTRLTVELRARTGGVLRTVRLRVVHARAVLVEGCPCWLLGCAFVEPLTDEELQPLL
jgi:hypothetical protein